MLPIPIAIDDHAVPVLLTQAVRETAQAVAALLTDPDQAQRVYRNTLAVYAVHTYLTLLGIETELSKGDLWPAILYSGGDTADLLVVGRGRLECRPVWPGETVLDIPAEAQLARIAYLAVEIADNPTEVQILGFADPMVSEAPGPLTSMESFLSHLWAIHYTDLRQWLEHCFDATWQEPQAVLMKVAAAFRLRSEVGPPIRRAKRIELRSHPDGLALGLLVALRACDESLQISVQLHSVPQTRLAVEATDDALPAGVELLLLTDTAEQIQRVAARETFPDNFIQLLPFTGKAGEQYSVQVVFKGHSHTEVLTT